MEKITKDELLENLGGTPLSDEELTNVSGGDDSCMEGLVWNSKDQRCLPPTSGASLFTYK